MKNILNKIKSFLVNEQGAETVEWVLIVAILAALALAAYKTSLGGAINNAINSIATSMGGS